MRLSIECFQPVEGRPIPLPQRLLALEHREHRLAPAGDIGSGPRIVPVLGREHDHTLLLDVADLPTAAEQIVDDELDGHGGAPVREDAERGYGLAGLVVRRGVGQHEGEVLGLDGEHGAERVDERHRGARTIRQGSAPVEEANRLGPTCRDRLSSVRQVPDFDRAIGLR